MRITPAFFTVALLVAVFFGGFFISMIVDPYLPLQVSNTKKARVQGFSQAEELVRKSSFGGLFRSIDDTRFVSGKVIAINGNKITVHLQNNDPFDETFIEDRIVVISPFTKIIRQTLKDKAAFQDEVVGPLKNIFTATASRVPTKSPPPPSVPFVEIASDISSIQVGDAVFITASLNIKEMKEFNADKITIMPPLIF